MTVLALSLLVLDVSSLPHEKLENPDWWWGGWYEKRGPVTAAWYPKVWEKVVVSKYRNPKDRERISRFGWLLRHPFYPVPERVGWGLVAAVLISPIVAIFMTPRRYWSMTWWDDTPKWEWNRLRAILGATVYAGCVVMTGNYFLNYSTYYLMLGDLREAYHILHLWVTYIEPPLLALGTVIPLILMSKLELPCRRAKASILLAWLFFIAFLIAGYIHELSLLHTMGG